MCVYVRVREGKRGCELSQRESVCVCVCKRGKERM